MFTNTNCPNYYCYQSPEICTTLYYTNACNILCDVSFLCLKLIFQYVILCAIVDIFEPISTCLTSILFLMTIWRYLQRVFLHCKLALPLLPSGPFSLQLDGEKLQRATTKRRQEVKLFSRNNSILYFGQKSLLCPVLSSICREEVVRAFSDRKPFSSFQMFIDQRLSLSS